MNLKKLLSMLLIAALLLSPVALMEETAGPEPVIFEEEAVASPDGEAENEPTDDFAEATDEDNETDVVEDVASISEESLDIVVTDPIDEIIEEQPANLNDITVLPSEDYAEEHDLDELEGSDEAEPAFLMAAGADGIAIDESNFPDADFRIYISKVIDSDNDGMLSETERMSVTSIVLPYEYIGEDQSQKSAVPADLTGIKLFSNLEVLTLGCFEDGYYHDNYDGTMNTLDVSGCVNLRELYCSEVELQSLNLMGCNSLSILRCQYNQLTNLDMSSCNNLDVLDCYNNQLTNLDLSNCNNLKRLFCFSNPLTSLDVHGCYYLEELSCRECGLTDLDVSNNPKLTFIDCNDNNLTTLNLSNNHNLTDIRCDGNNISSLDLDNKPGLEELWCDDNAITELNLSSNPELQYLYCRNNNIKSLILGANSELTMLRCDNNDISELNISECPQILLLMRDDYYQDYDTYIRYSAKWGDSYYTYCFTYDKKTALKVKLDNDIIVASINEQFFPDATFCAYVKENFDRNGDGLLSYQESTMVFGIGLENRNITSLQGIEFFPNLGYLGVSYNQLTSLDVRQNTKLWNLECDNNQLTELLIGSNIYLESIACNNNQLKSLDVSGLTRLEVLICKYNQLSSLLVLKCRSLKHIECYKNQIDSLNISDCQEILQYVNEEGYEEKTIDDVTFDSYGYNIDDWWWSVGIILDKNVEIITDDPSVPDQEPDPVIEPDPTVQPVIPSEDVSSTPTDTTSATESPAAIPSPVIPAIKKSGKQTVVAAPGTVCLLDLGGATGKAFKSSNKKVVTVDQSGNVTVKKAGKAKITFKVGKKKRTVTLTVKDPTIPTSIALNLSGTVAAKKGETATLTYTLPAGTSSGVKWTSSNKKVATVKNGIVTFKKKGKVTITATCTRGKKKAKVKFKVSN